MDADNAVSSRAEAVQKLIFAILVEVITAMFRESSSYTTEKLVLNVQVDHTIPLSNHTSTVLG